MQTGKKAAKTRIKLLTSAIDNSHKQEWQPTQMSLGGRITMARRHAITGTVPKVNFYKGLHLYPPPPKGTPPDLEPC